MTTLLNLLATIALLVWSTQLVRTGILRAGRWALGANFRQVLAQIVRTRLKASLFSSDLSWLWPLFILIGVILFISR